MNEHDDVSPIAHHGRGPSVPAWRDWKIGSCSTRPPGCSGPRPKLITYSFVPDGTSIGGVPSNLQQTLNAHFTTADWQAQFAKAASVWQKMANINFTRVSDNGAALGVSGNLQSDSRFGDIRIGGYAMSGNILAFAYLLPPANGGTDAGDIFFNTKHVVADQRDDLRPDDRGDPRVRPRSRHGPFGHDSTAAMWPSYTGTKQAVTPTTPPGSARSTTPARTTSSTPTGPTTPIASADNISSYIDGNGQFTLSALDSTTPIMIGSNDTDWYKITVPATTTGTMVVRMQSTKLSLLSPAWPSTTRRGRRCWGRRSPTAWGDTVTVTINNVSAGQVYDIRCQGGDEPATRDSGPTACR